jgi:serine phosphatase RsbU (regulator of sigma subunit)
MDISLCVINKRTNELSYAGAYNSIYIINKAAKTLKEMSADKHPVGAFIEDNLKSFTTKTHQLSSEEVVYMFTDGYADQFGGEKGKKFKYKNLQELLFRVCGQDFEIQKKVIAQTINDWKGHYEQVDDMLLLGFNI